MASIRKGTGYVDTANDLLALARLFLGRWPELEGIVYLRWNEGDADTLVPSLFQGRPRRRRAVETPAEPSAPAPTDPEGPGAVLKT